MKIVHLSDTHGFHEGQCETWLREIAETQQPEVIVHSGDFMRHAMHPEDFSDFVRWFMALPFEHKVLVPGNHDKWCEAFEEDIALRQEWLPSDLHFLINESTQIEGVNFWGSPYTPEFFDWGFQLFATQGLDLWSRVPEHTDVLVTHGPAMGTLDTVLSGESAGCPFLAARVDEIQLKAHLFGHIHEAYGEAFENHLALNSALLNANHQVANKPQVLEI